MSSFRTPNLATLWRRCLPLLFAMAWVASTQAQQTITIGTGTVSAYYVPVTTLWNYSYTQQLYMGSELTANG